MNVTIFKKNKTAMQSGRGKAGQWVIEPELPTARVPEPLMGWQSSGDTLNQLELRFDSREEAELFAASKGWHVIVMPEHNRKMPRSSYMDNFK